MRKKRVELVTQNLGYGKVLAGRNKLKRKLLAKSKFVEIGNTRVHHGEWRNWYTRLPQKQLPKGLRVRVPPHRLKSSCYESMKSSVSSTRKHKVKSFNMLKCEGLFSNRIGYIEGKSS